MKVLVTGGAGFIGSHLVDRLLQDPTSEVFVVDNLLTGTAKNLENACKSANFHFYNFDVTELEQFPITEVVFDQVYHLACPASPPHYQKDPIKTMLINVLGTNNMLELAKRNGARFLLSSTSEVYGDPLEHPQSETYWGNVNCTGPRSCYDEGKRAAETLTFDFHRLHAVDIRVVRIFNTYGPRMAIEDGRVVSNMLVQALTGKPITVYGSGKQTRSFCYIDDLIDGMITFMNSECYSGPLNLGNPQEYPIIELVKIVETLFPQTQLNFVHKDLPQDDPRRRKPNITLAEQIINWKPRTPLTVGLKETLKDFRRQVCESTNYHNEK